jgi:hypothetical protein
MTIRQRFEIDHFSCNIALSAHTQFISSRGDHGVGYAAAERFESRIWNGRDISCAGLPTTCAVADGASAETDAVQTLLKDLQTNLNSTHLSTQRMLTF